MKFIWTWLHDRSPNISSSFRDIDSAKDKQILKIALSLFCKKGYHSISIEDSIEEIARQAEISKGLLYHYFKSKAEVLGALVDIRI
ncbi:MAG TPA: helix-turn-helix domain-containing protein [Coleofasciculaceae cyanobacterium]